MMRTGRIAARIGGATIALLLAFALTDPSASQAPAGGTSGQMPEMKQTVVEAYGKLPFRFEANQGQTGPEVDFLARGKGYTLYLTGTEAVLVLRQGQGSRPGVLRMKFVGANPAPQVAGLEQLPGTANYFVGNDPRAWRTGIPTYAKVEYRDVYPGVDLVYYGRQGQLEYDFVVAPGADPGAIRLGFAGTDSLEIDARGDLVLHTAAGEIRQRKPFIYQELNGARQEIAGGYVLRGRDQIAFQVAAYDASRPLVIDPVLSYSTFLGGGSDDVGYAIAVDKDGNAYVTGFTASTDFPTTQGSFDAICGTDGACNFSSDAFVTKLDPTGAPVYSTYFGGNSEDTGLGIAVDRTTGSAYVTGFTFSTDFLPLNPLQTPGGLRDAFVTKLDPTGAPVYSTYLGGNDFDEGNAIAVDNGGNAYVTGSTSSAAFPGASAVRRYMGGGDAFVAKVNPGGSGLTYFTYLGGSGNDGGFGIAVDIPGNAYVTGQTFSSADFPTTTGAFDTTFNGPGSDAFVTKLNASGSLAYSTYLGGGGTDEGNGIAVDRTTGNAYVTGRTDSMTPSAFPTANVLTLPSGSGTGTGSSGDAFVTKLNPAASGEASLVYSTYLGGISPDVGRGIAVDASGNAYVTGETMSLLDDPPVAPAFPTVNASQAPCNAQSSTGVPSSSVCFGGDGFVAKISDPISPVPPDPPKLVEFDEFRLREVDLDRDDDDFDRDAFKARFRLGVNSDGINPVSEKVTIQVGSAFVTIEPCQDSLKAGRDCFKKDRKGRFKFEGRISDSNVKVKVSIRPLGDGSFNLTFKAKGEDADKYRHRGRDHRYGDRHRRYEHRYEDVPFWWSKRGAGTSSDIAVGLSIGDCTKACDTGSTTWTAKRGQRGSHDRDDHRGRRDRDDRRGRGRGGDRDD